MRGRVPDGKVCLRYDYRDHGVNYCRRVGFPGGAVMDKQEFFTTVQIAGFFALAVWFWCTLLEALAWSAW